MNAISAQWRMAYIQGENAGLRTLRPDRILRNGLRPPPQAKGFVM
jgi:hypothetical protein